MLPNSMAPLSRNTFLAECAFAGQEMSNATALKSKCIGEIDESFDVAVIGAGPAGALCARECARLGLTVLLVDRAKFPRYKVCGCCLSQGAICLLERLGLKEVIDSCQAIDLKELLVFVANK